MKTIRRTSRLFFWHNHINEIPSPLSLLFFFGIQPQDMFAPKMAEVIQEHEQEEVEDMGDYLRLCKTTEVVQEHEPEEVRIMGDYLRVCLLH